MGPLQRKGTIANVKVQHVFALVLQVGAMALDHIHIVVAVRAHQASRMNWTRRKMKRFRNFTLYVYECTLAYKR